MSAATNNIIPLNREQTMQLPEPPVPADFSLQGYNSFLFDTQRFLNSELALSADPAAIGVAVLLWASAWQQVPCGSIPDDDKQLARLAGFGRDVDSFLKLKEEALHGFYKCNDGRYYHRFLVKVAQEANAKREVLKANGKRGGRPKKSETEQNTNEKNHLVSEKNHLVSESEPKVTNLKAIEVNRIEEKNIYPDNTPSPSPTESASGDAGACDLAFGDLVSGYPFEVGKLKPARVEFNRLCKGKSAEKIKTSVTAMLEVMQAQRGEIGANDSPWLRMSLVNYLAEKCWTKEPPIWAKQGKGGAA